VKLNEIDGFDNPEVREYHCDIVAELMDMGELGMDGPME
jgi:hypothetical protein